MSKFGYLCADFCKVNMIRERKQSEVFNISLPLILHALSLRLKVSSKNFFPEKGFVYLATALLTTFCENK